MKREQQIEKASIGRYPEWGEQQHALELAFQAGAIWADSHPHWISVEDELPKESDYYLCVIGADAGQGVLWYNDGVEEWYEVHCTKEEYLSCEDLTSKVTHWIPLPAPPTCSEKPNNCTKGGEQ